MGLPRLPEPPFRRAVPTTPADRAGARVDYFPAHAAFPKWQEGRHPLSLSRPAQASLALRPAGSLSRPRRPLSRGSSPSGCPAEPLVSYRINPAEPLVSYRINRQLSGWNPPPLVIRAFGAHCHFRTSRAGSRGSKDPWPRSVARCPDLASLRRDDRCRIPPPPGARGKDSERFGKSVDLHLRL